MLSLVPQTGEIRKQEKSEKVDRKKERREARRENKREGMSMYAQTVNDICIPRFNAITSTANPDRSAHIKGIGKKKVVQPCHLFI